ncbi:MAG: OsmC family protein [bacterium]
MQSRSGGTESITSPSPVESVLIALCACSGVDVVEILQKMHANLTGLYMEADAERAPEPPRVFTKIHVRFRCEGRGLTRAQAERAVNLSLEKYCSIAAMLRKTAALSYEVVLEEP